MACVLLRAHIPFIFISAHTYHSYFCAHIPFIFLHMRKAYHHCNACDRSNGVDSMVASTSVFCCASAYVSKPVLVQGPFLLHRSVFSSIPGYTELLCKYTVLVAILVLHRGVQASVSALFFVSPMKCKSCTYSGVFSDLQCMSHKSL